MKIEQIINKDNFNTIQSEPQWFWTWTVRLLLITLGATIILLIFLIPWLFYIEGTINFTAFITFSVFYFLIIIWLTLRALRYLKRVKNNANRHLTINKEGMIFEKLNGNFEHIKYNQLDKSSESKYDVFIDIDRFFANGVWYRNAYLTVFIDGQKRRIHSFHPDMAYSYFAKNKRLMRSHFIRGIALFRPDLQIDPLVYSEFLIDPETFEFRKNEYWITFIVAAIFLILTFLGIELYMKYRMGDSLIF